MADVYTEIATDALVSTQDTLLTAYSSNWTLCNPAFDFKYNVVTVVSEGFRPTAALGGYIAAFWNDDTFPANQYAEVVVPDMPAGQFLGVCVRASDDETFYAYVGDTRDNELVKVVNGTATVLGTDGTTWSGGDTIRLEIVGTSLRPLINGSLAPIGVVNDASISSGQAGIAGSGNDTRGVLNTWAAGSIVSDRRGRVAAINVGCPFMRFQPIPDANLDNEADRAWIAGFYSGLVSEDTPFSTAMDIGSIEDARDQYRFAALGTGYEFRSLRTGYQFQAPRTAYHLADGRTKYRFYVTEPES